MYPITPQIHLQKKKVLFIFLLKVFYIQLPHTVQNDNKCFPSLLLLSPLFCPVSWHQQHLGGIMGKCHTSRITVYLLSSPRLTSSHRSSSSYSRVTQPIHTSAISSLSATLVETKHRCDHTRRMLYLLKRLRGKNHFTCFEISFKLNKIAPFALLICIAGGK